MKRIIWASVMAGSLVLSLALWGFYVGRGAAR